MPPYDKLQLLLVVKVGFPGIKESESFEANDQAVESTFCSVATLRGRCNGVQQHSVTEKDFSAR